jgi:hypothetical protein
VSINVGENRDPRDKLEGTVSQRTFVKATFNPDGTMTMSLCSEGDGIRVSLKVPDESRPGDVARWTVVRTDGDAVVIRLVSPEHPDAPEWRVDFRGRDAFSAPPVNPSKGAIQFRRVGR